MTFLYEWGTLGQSNNEATIKRLSDTPFTCVPVLPIVTLICLVGHQSPRLPTCMRDGNCHCVSACVFAFKLITQIYIRMDHKKLFPFSMNWLLNWFAVCLVRTAICLSLLFCLVCSFTFIDPSRSSPRTLSPSVCNDHQHFIEVLSHYDVYINLLLSFSCKLTHSTVKQTLICSFLYYRLEFRKSSEFWPVVFNKC